MQLRVLNHTAAQAQPACQTHQVHAMGAAAQLGLLLAVLASLYLRLLPHLASQLVPSVTSEAMSPLWLRQRPNHLGPKGVPPVGSSLIAAAAAC